MDKAMQKETKREGKFPPVRRLTPCGIKLEVIDRDTGKPVNYGIQLNNTTLEIEALPNLKVFLVYEDATMQAYKEAYRLAYGEEVKVKKRIKVRYVVQDGENKERTATQMDTLTKELLDREPYQGDKKL